MTVAALYDIHGNLPALEAVLADPAFARADAVVVGGDVAAGPLPAQVLDRLSALWLPVSWVRGNADREVVACFDRGDEPLVICGHTHHQFDLSADGRRVVNAGSVGMPYEGGAGAYWLLLEDGEPELRRTDVELEPMAAALRASGFPDVEDMLRESFEAPVTAATVAEHFERRAAGR